MNNRLKDVLKQNKVTQKELGEMIGLGQQRISQFVTGSHIPSLKQALEISNLFGERVEDIWWINEKE